MPEGKVLAQVRLPARGRLAAFGRGVIYLIVPDSDDVERVRRYAYPAPPAPLTPVTGGAARRFPQWR